jgi:hypothetical protein
MADESTTGSTEAAAGSTASTTSTGTPPANGGQQTADEKKFTQADLDKLINERLERAKKSGAGELLESLGVKSADELKKTLEAQRKAEEDKLSEVDKAKKAAEKLQQEREALQAELQKERDGRKQEKLDAAIKSTAKGAHDGDEVVLLLRRNFSDRVAKALKDDGTIDQKVLDDLVTDLKKSKPYLFGGSGAGSPSNHGGKTPEPDAKAKEQARLEQARRMKRKF